MKVSIITPCFNAAKYIADAIKSVLAQDYQDWELIIVNDGSTDNSEGIILDFTDTRIRYCKQENKGVSAARNVGLSMMTGDFFCFLDADDVFTSRSLSSRVKIFCSNNKVFFVDGKVEIRNSDLSKAISVYAPTIKGNPISDLLQLNPACFFGPTWMFRRILDKNYQFKEGLTHGEDLLFYIQNGQDGELSFTTEYILFYRKGHISAMSNINGLEKGYRLLVQEVSQSAEFSNSLKKTFKNKTQKIMLKSYLRELDVIGFLRVLFNW